METKLEWLDNPEVFKVNRMDAHSDHKYYSGFEEMAQKNQTWKQSLNGTWKFHWGKNPNERAKNFWKKEFDTAGFDEIQVPGHMELQGYDKIHYINTMYPWEGHAQIRPPKTDPDYNPVGSYVKEFDLAPKMLGKRVCVSFQGVEEAMYLWLNGEFIGYSEDSFTPSEFDLTKCIKEKGNKLCVAVYKRSSAAWLEDQDFFRFSGIFREVCLFAKPFIHIEDLWIQTRLLEDYKTGRYSLKCKISKELQDGQSKMVLDFGEERIKIKYKIYDSQEKLVAEHIHEDSKTNQEGYFELPENILEDVNVWSDKSPNLYEFVVCVMDDNNNIIEVIPYKIGFLRFEIKEQIMMINGERLIINGVNRHEWNPDTGRAITKEDMLKDIEILKKNHINAVRTSHYPNQTLWYELCDENGIYIMDETNLESHGSWQKMGKCDPRWNVPGSLREWEACVLDRAESMFERDKNHTSILWWSLGNESYAGECILAMSDYFHKKDHTRAVHYEGVYWNRKYDRASDVESRMYASPKEVEEYLTNNPTKPFLLCEYMHDMGNSLGGMESYMKLRETYPSFQGGFIWDYIDQALYKKDVYGRKILAYGGDFDDRPSDYSFSGNGIVFADRTEKPAMQEVRFWYSLEEEQKNHIENNNKAAKKADDGLKAVQKVNKNISIVHGDVTCAVKGEGFHVIFSYQEHGIVSLVYDGIEWLYRTPTPTFWRASTENDLGNHFSHKSSVWLSANTFLECKGWNIVQESETELSIQYTYETITIPKTQVKVSYTVDGSGSITTHVCYEGQKGLPELPLFGMRFIIPDIIQRIKWQGLSGETYPDRKAGGIFGIHESTIEIPKYLVPQECGNHMDTRWVQLFRKHNSGLEIRMKNKPFAFSALPNTAEELESAKHVEELPMTGRTVLNILSKMRGVGGIDSWGSDVEEAYRILAEEKIEYEFIICKVSK